MREDPATSFALKASGWLVPEVRQHLFFLVWICGVPIHVRYVVHLLRMSAVPLEMMATTTTSAGVETNQDPRNALWGAHNRVAQYPSQRMLEAAALDILFVLVVDDCCAANAEVKRARLSVEPWSEVRSLTFSAGGDGVENTTAQVILHETIVKGEVLALLPVGNVPPEESESMYFTALEQARFFEQQHVCSFAVPDADCRADRRSRAAVQNEEGRGTRVVDGGKADVIVIDSDDSEDLVEREVVVLSSDSTGSSCRSVRKRQKLS